MPTDQPRPRAASRIASLVAALAVLYGVYWAFRGTLTTIWREVLASGTLKVSLIAVIVTGVLMTRAVAKKSTRLSTISMVLGIAVIVGYIPGAITGGFDRQAALLDSVGTTDKAQPEYDWRLPWSTAAASASSRAGDVIGDFDSDSTTYLPATDTYATPVVAKGFITGFDQVVIQSRDSATAQVCSFADQAPRGYGWFSHNLRRALTHVDASITADPDDAWAYCDGDTAKVVIPVTRYEPGFEGHRVPAGVVIYDGKDVEHLRTVEPGDLPGPVYPASLAAAQRASTVAAKGWWAKVTKRTGYETVETAKVEDDEDGDDNPDAGNPTELLLARADGSGWDYVTALTPRGASSSIIALATIAADRVTDGELNPLTVYTLNDSREGNQALSNRITTAFPELNWKANSLSVVEVLPTSEGVWTATIANATSATRRVEINTDRSLCLTDLNGTVEKWVDGTGSTQTPAGQDDSDQNEPVPNADLGSLSNEDLLILQEQVNKEIAGRLTSPREVGQG